MKLDFIKELLFEARTPYLKEYNTLKVNELIEKSNKIQDEMTNIQNEMTEIQESTGQQEIPPEISKKYMFLKSTLDYYQRVLKSYNFSRYRKIQELIFQNEDVSEKISPQEKEHANFFIEIYNEYKNNFPDIDFINNYIPRHHFVHFITLEDCGIVMDGDEIYELKENRYFYMKKSVIKHLIGTEMIKIL